jgi:hypothetical protein
MAADISDTALVNCFHLRSDEELNRAKKIVEDYKAGKEVNLSDDEIWVHLRFFCVGCYC